jgi:hypothetical protein
MRLTLDVKEQIVASVLEAQNVQSIEVMSGARMATVGAAMRHALEQAGADNDDLASVLGHAVLQIDGDPTLSDAQRSKSIIGICESFRFDVRRMPMGEHAVKYALKPRMTN